MRHRADGFGMRRSGRFQRRGGRLFDFVAAFGAILLLALVASRVQGPLSPDIEGRAQVVDGDSLLVSSQRIRLAGIDAPELDQICRHGAVSYPCGRDAKTALARLIGGAAVSCAVIGRDRYARDLGECVAGATDLNAAMVRAGHAVAFGNYEVEEGLAQAERAGLWGGEFTQPSDWRREKGKAEEPVHAGLTGIRALLRRLIGV